MRWWVVDRFTNDPKGQRVQVSGERFASVMHRLGVRATVDVPDRLGAAATRRFDVEFERPRALRVADLIEASPVLRALRELAERLRREREISPAAAASRVEAIVGKGRLAARLAPEAGNDPEASAPPAPAPPLAPPEATSVPSREGSSGGNDIFSQVELPTASGGESTLEVAKTGVDAFVGAILGKTKASSPGVSPDVRASAAEQILAAVTATAVDILEHPEVAGLEASWRGLKMVMAASPGHDQLSIELVDTAAEALTSGWTLPTSGKERPDAVFVGPALRDLSQLQALADWAEKHQIPVVVAIDEALPFGDLANTSQSDDATPAWSAFRQESRSQWVCVAMNPVVLVHEETAIGPRFLGGSPAFALAAMLGAALEREAGLQSIVGPRRAWVAPAAHDVELSAGERRTIPTAYFASWTVQQASARLGITLLGSEAGSDRVIVADTPMVHGPQASLVPRIRAACAARCATR